MKAMTQILDSRGNSPRLYRNTLCFLAADHTRLAELEQAVRDFLAWQSIEVERETLNLDAFQRNQAQTKRQEADETVRHRIPETFQWLLVPEQETLNASLNWREIRLQGDGSLAIRAARKLENEGLLLTEYAPTLLRLELDRIPLWRGDHVKLQQLADDFAQYLYLPRLQHPELLTLAAEAGLCMLTWEQDAFAYAEMYDPQHTRYRGLCAGRASQVRMDTESVLVKPNIAKRQLAEEARLPEPEPSHGVVQEAVAEEGYEGKPSATSEVPTIAPREKQQPKRFYGVISLDPLRISRETGQIAEEVIQHLAGLLHANVEVTLEINAEVPEGIPDHVMRIVNENCRTLRFKAQGFEEE